MSIRLRYDPNYPTPESEETVVSSEGGGCLSAFILPPLAVLFVGTILAVVLFNAGPPGAIPVRAASAPQALGVVETSGGEVPMPAGGSMLGKPGDISPIFMPEVQYWSSEIQAWAAQAGIDPNLVATVMQIESCGFQKAISRAGAIGLFQVMPYHFASGDDPYDPDTNATRGLAYLKRSLEAAGGDIRLALAGYNGGIGVIGRPESSWAGQTQGYVKAGARIYSKASSSNITAEDVRQWTSSQSALCRQAAALEGISR